MPLCSVEVPRGSVPEVIQKAKNLAGDSLEIAHRILNVPDPEDLEINIIEGKGGLTRLRISYTIGPNEYPDFPIPSFKPTKEQVNQTGKEIQVMADQGETAVGQTTIEAWSNTTFVIRNPQAQKLTQVPEDLKEIGLSVEKPQLRLIVSPEKQGQTVLPREFEPTTEHEPNLEFIEGVGKKLSEILGLPEDPPIPIYIQPTLFADSDFTVEFDCQPIGDYLIPKEARTYMAQLIEQELNQNPSTRNGNAEVWIRQGQPVSYHFASE